MAPTTTRRKRDRAARRTDAFLGYLIPLFLIGLATYQQITDHHTDKYVIGALFVLCLGSLGWRIDIILEKYIEARAGVERSRRNDPDGDE